MRALEELRTGTGAVPAAARRSVRVTLAACLAFYVLLYGLDRSVGATYALFAAVALAGLSRIPGSGRQRAVVIVRVLPVTCVLVVIGTFLAVRTWTAVAGMLVIGFCLAFAAAGGPRPAGAAPGLQLMYILPSFPPYAPDDLPERLGGTLVGLVLLILAERYVLPDPRVPGYRDRAADAAVEAARCASDLERPPHTLPAAEAERSKAVAETLRPSLVPEAERPAGPGVRERALAHTGLAARTLLARLRNLPAPAAGLPARKPGLHVVRAVRESADGTAVLLREGNPPPTDSAPCGGCGPNSPTPRSRSRAPAPGTPRCWRSPTPRSSCARRRNSPCTAGRPDGKATRRTASGTPARARPACGGTGSPGTAARGPCTSRTPSGSPWPSPSPAPWPGSTRSRTASGPCSPWSA
ncbi:hypothetical protein OS965_10775 [Streptomyces sp. H27-G5]|uniref:hypothetical protein n=1 Tax=Streptomyces sp. H27-G5 TaxID=2996698 RepID=UPI00226FC1E1|nr:hypothetical protein [Streptomyces sp. H27-G5]MCY0918655.1 hypothetical protein [Streptomyces sp. H27-G5]